MNDEVAIKVDHISKKYCKSLKRSMLYGVKDIGKNMLGLSSHSEKLRKSEFWAVNNVSFDVEKGESLGIIGPNGSGKTTLLKMLNGIFWPDKGKITVEGRVGALIEVGAGFHPLLTGRGNVYINAAILGMTKDEVNAKFDDIVEFADIGNFLDTPVKFYSSGMFVRLGFAVAVHCEPDILLVDEVLAVGDYNFQSRCFNKIGEMRKGGVTTIFVSHNMHLISGLCTRVLYLNSGHVKYDGETGEGINFYVKDVMYAKNLLEFRFETENVESTGRVRFTKIQFLDKNEDSVTEISAGDPLTLRIYYTAKEEIRFVDLDILIKDDTGIFFQATNKTYERELFISKGSGYIDVYFKSIPANNQKLLFYITLWKYDRSEFLDCKRGLNLFVSGKPSSSGKILLNVDWICKQGSNLSHEIWKKGFKINE